MSTDFDSWSFLACSVVMALALLVMVGATWCPACARMKTDVMPGLQRSGALQKFHFAQVDIDEQHELAGRLSNAAVIPQLILYRKTPAGWKRWET